MTRRIVSIHGFRRGTGKTNVAVNLATVMAQSGLRVGLIDTDERSPNIADAFGVPQPNGTLHDLLTEKVGVSEAVVQIPISAPDGGGLWLIAFPIYSAEVAIMLKQKYDVELLNEGYHKLIDELQLDVLLVDTVAGLDEETLLTIATSDTLVEVLRPNQRDYHGTSVTVDVARRLQIANIYTVLNMVPTSTDWDALTKQIETTYGCPVLAVVPHVDEVQTGIYAQAHPDAPLTQLYRTMGQALTD